MKSHPLISRNADLKQIQDDGYDMELVADKFLLVQNVPYVNSQKQVKRGVLVMELTFSGDDTVVPHTHTANFIGEHPCNADGSGMTRLKHSSGPTQLSAGLMVDHMFSMKPDGGYKNFHHKVQLYTAAIEGPALLLDGSATSRVYPTYEYAESESVFRYPDTATSKAGIDGLNSKLAGQKIAIIGLGGTGSYVLDLVAKTPVQEIHLFDRDQFLNHNAFRSPGAASLQLLRSRPNKAAYFASVYSNMRWGVYAHEYFVNAGHGSDLAGMDFVFICIDRGQDKPAIMAELDEHGIPYVDAGIGIELVDGALLGTVRTVRVTKKCAPKAVRNIPVQQDNAQNEYARNIQIAEINSINACLAVLAWKKSVGYYRDDGMEHTSLFSIAGNTLIKEK